MTFARLQEERFVEDRFPFSNISFMVTVSCSSLYASFMLALSLDLLFGTWCLQCMKLLQEQQNIKGHTMWSVDASVHTAWKMFFNKVLGWFCSLTQRCLYSRGSLTSCSFVLVIWMQGCGTRVSVHSHSFPLLLSLSNSQPPHAAGAK